MSLPTTCCDVLFPNPIVLASGILGTEAGLLTRVARAGAGGVTSKSASVRPRMGHPNPTVLDWGYGLINAVGLANPGLAAEVAILQEAKTMLKPLNVPLIASIFAETIDEFGRAAAIVSRAQPDLIEVNISCPNVGHELGRPFALDPENAAAVTKAVRNNSDLPIIVKLSPNVTDIVEIGLAAEAAGADAIAAINSVAGMVIDIHAARPILANREGGLSGPAIKPIALRAVYNLYEAVQIPIVGIGGVSSGRDALEMIMAGATLVGVGSAVRQRGVSALGEIATELAHLLDDLGYDSPVSAKGVAHVAR